jgi:HEPN domain-containing protein
MANLFEAKIQRELEAARLAREAGKEGQARVCARRAAGLAAQAYLTRHGQPAGGPSALQALGELAAAPYAPERARLAAARLTERVNAAFSLPAGIDLIEEAQLLLELLKP